MQTSKEPEKHQNQIPINQLPSKFLHILREIYEAQASIVIITGKWKTGKTDFSLLIAEILLRLKLVSKVASNIQTGEGTPVKFLNALSTVKIWAKESGNKVFVYDEVIESSPSRSAMSRLNVEWVKFIPQLSKCHTHLLVLTQEQTLIDSVFKNPTFCRGIWKKLSKKTAVFNSQMLDEEYMLSGLPKTDIPFDPDLTATFAIEQSSLDLNLLPRTLQVATLYAQPANRMNDIQASLKLEREQVKRELRRICKILVTMSHGDSDGKVIQKLCDQKDAYDE